MSISKFPHGIFATPNIGGSRFADLWNSENVFFVDGDNGSAGGGGQSVDDTVTLISIAVNLASKGASVYVRPRSTAASAQTYYTDNITIPITKPGLSIFGAGANSARPFLGVDIKAVPITGVTSPVVNVLAAGVHLEGMRLAGTGQTAGYPIVKAYASALGNGSVGLQIVNCRLDNAKTGGAIAFDSPNHAEIRGCSFDECAIGITSSIWYGGVASRGLKIFDCDFGGRVATRNMDIYISQSGAGTGAGIAGYEIRECRFLDGTPTLGSDNKFIKIANGDVGMISDSRFYTDPGGDHRSTYGAAGSECIIPTSWQMVACRGGGVDIDFIHPIGA